ncbi:hypothetical protein VC83_06744 [Pseudogymnoascus destructans]|uniref:Uncharacterized protein n=2 Tax=Pseudogymnoascus destructans TaxID=655981 RepID=L8G4Z4_PSED2|nr:uncharacterized protein VC83_06744 [Pseudogymnoascus destructans]ELR07036.1 hypothetical protein GMDG_02358 [Pseudogymnoascus destructans 20631-21]OAF56371.1 hypothetical protein VC83_06744 [Pseudogymnoascus destructans]
MRRRLIRGLHYLIHGKDAVGGPEMGAATVMHLLEEEGLMDHFLVARMGPGIEQTASMFATESNARIARLAIEQDTWLGKLSGASRLYGRGDANYYLVAAGLRVLHGLPEWR